MLKNSAGQYDGSWSLAVYSWLVVCVCIFLSVFEKLTIGSFDLSFKVPNDTLLLGFLGTMTANYCYRRTKKDANSSETDATTQETKKDEP